MGLKDVIASDITNVFLRTDDFAEVVVVGSTSYNAIVAVQNYDGIEGVNVKNSAKIYLAVKLPYMTAIVANGLTWRVQYCNDLAGIYEHICYEDERVNYRG